MNNTVLVVDDAAFMRMMLKNILIQEGYEIVAEGENGKDAIELYRKYKPSFVTMDITMPVMDGIEALKGIKEEDPEAKIIMCSALGQENKVKEAIMNGAIDFIVKPFKVERVVEAIDRCMR